MSLTISAGTLGTLALRRFCPRCFWLELKMKEVPFRQPLPGIFSSIDSYVKNVVRKHYDETGNLPSWYPDVGKVVGYEARMHWRRFQVIHEETGATLRGVPDELLHTEGGGYHVIDYKTTRVSRTQHSLYPAYEVQLNAYGYISRRIGLDPITALSLIYLDPDTDLKASPDWITRSEETLMLSFTPYTKEVEIKDGAFIEELLSRAAEIDALTELPPQSPGCNNCSLTKELADIVLQQGPLGPLTPI
jgi:hypothetical protein